MKYVNNIEKMSPDECDRSLRFAVRDRPGATLRDTYFLVDPESSPSKNLKMGLTVVYANGKTTGHAHPQHEEVYYVLQGRGRMIVGESQYDISAGDALYVPFGAFHTTHNTGILPLQLLWVTGRDPSGGMDPTRPE
jgi:oxalate decarboxylase/phosphoglucose isomerase-like protein (cupin superfamily)